MRVVLPSAVSSKARGGCTIFGAIGGSETLTGVGVRMGVGGLGVGATTLFS